MKGIRSWPTLAAVVTLAALTGLGFRSTPAMAETPSQNYENRDDGSSGYSDQNSPRGFRRREQGRGGQDYRDDRRNQDSPDGSSGYFGYRDSRGGQWDQGGSWNNCERGQWAQGRSWNNGDGGRRYQGRRWNRRDYGQVRYGYGSCGSGWRDEDYSGDRGSCGY